ncbi:hypothetical protein MJO28_012399 [Puccinia striiformis f. sp. tritici]|uniref:Phosducin domain-containing protein n=3 Tax=Puccinia striiformis TaxID=27350 RepID=A0A0L0UVJ3_9BASI
MPTLEQAALSGALTSIPLVGERDPDGREPDRKHDEDEDFEDLIENNQSEVDDDDGDEFRVRHRNRNTERDNTNYGYLNPAQARSNSSSPGGGSQSMSRGWSGNTGPKGVLLDFKASHGKSGAILGGSNTPNYPRQTSMNSALAKRRSPSNNPSSRHHQLRPSSPSSESDSSDSSDRDHSHIRTNTSKFNSTKTTTRLIFSSSPSDPNNQPHHQSNRLRFGTSPASSSSNSSPNNNIRVDKRGRKLFGHLREVGVENFIQAVEAEKDDKETVVLVHLYDPALESCLILNTHLSNLARVYPRTKFLRALASELDFFNESPIITMNRSKNLGVVPSLGTSPMRGFERLNLMDDDPFGPPEDQEEEEERDIIIESSRTSKATDTDILPTLIWYRSGEYVQSLPALERELPLGGIVRGEQGCQDLQRLLRKNGIITGPESGPL